MPPKGSYFVKASKIISSAKEDFITGFMWDTDEQTIAAFNAITHLDKGFMEGGIVLDLYASEYENERTIVITEADYAALADTVTMFAASTKSDTGFV